MWGTPGRRSLAVVSGCVLALSACGGDGPADSAPTADPSQLVADCAAAVGTLLATTQRYLDSIEGTSPSDGTAPREQMDPAEDEEQFSRALSDIRSYAGSIGCDPATFRDDLAAGLDRLSTGGPVARAVLLQLRADAAPDGSQAGVAPGEDVAAAVAAAPQGAVVQLDAGEHVLGDTLVLLRGVTLRGAGRDGTTLRSAAPGGTVLVLTSDPVTFEDLTITRAGSTPASVVSAAPVATLAVIGARISGAVGDPAGTGGIGILMAAGPAGQGGVSRRTSLRVTDSEVVDNAVAGVVVSGEHRAEIAGAVVERSGQCGICFLATSDGTVRASRLAGNAAGIVAAGDARPAVSGATVEGGEVGVQALDRAAPQLEGTTVSRAARAAFLFTASATGSVRGSTCSDSGAGIVVGPSAAPELEGNTGCELARGQ